MTVMRTVTVTVVRAVTMTMVRGKGSNEVLTNGDE